MRISTNTLILLLNEGDGEAASLYADICQLENSDAYIIISSGGKLAFRVSGGMGVTYWALHRRTLGTSAFNHL
jgi:hypothetical protein